MQSCSFSHPEIHWDEDQLGGSTCPMCSAWTEHLDEMGKLQTTTDKLMKHYLIRLLCGAAPENGFAQDAIEYAIASNWIRLTYDNYEKDIQTIMANYDTICEAYHQVLQKNPEANPQALFTPRQAAA